MPAASAASRTTAIESYFIAVSSIYDRLYPDLHPRRSPNNHIFVGLSQQNAERLIAAFRDFGFDVPELTVGVFMEPGKIVRIGVPPLRLEIMNEISGVSFDHFQQAYRRSHRWNSSVFY